MVITAGSTIAAMIFRRPAQRGQYSISISNTRLSRHAQLMRAGASGGGVWAWGIASLMHVDRLARNDLSPYFGVRREHAMEVNQMQPREAGPVPLKRCMNSSGDITIDKWR